MSPTLRAGRWLLATFAVLSIAAAVRGADAVDPATLPAWKRYVWQDLAPILSRGEESRLLAQPDAAALDDWVRRFWLDKDPTPTTPVNERREEHLKRLETARALYPADNAIGLDQRGKDYVLFGPPDETSEIDEWFDETGHHPARLIWIWLHPPMRATYADWNLDGEWEQAWDETPSSRPDVSYRLERAVMQDSQAEDAQLLTDLRQSDPLAYQDLMRQLAEGEIVNMLEIKNQKLLADLMGSKFRKMEAAYLENRRDRTDTYVHDFKAEPLWAVFAVDCFRGADGRSRVELTHEVRLNDLGFAYDEGRQDFAAALLRRAVFYDADERVAASVEDRQPVYAQSLEDTRRPLLLPGLAAVQLRPGDYRLALRLEDERTHRLQVFDTRVSVPGFPPDSLLISDVAFASGLQRGEAPARFAHGEWIVTPHPLHAYATDRNIQLYFEVYGLATDADGLNDYTVTYRIRPKNPVVKSSWLWTRQEADDAEAGSTFADRHGGEMARHPLSIPAAEFAEDSYVLEVEVLDRVSGASARGRGQFSVLPPSALQ
ncbi:MAG: GWxTD domain-containing protein [Candidatus Krumholzibacteriia bacterium]|nr:GWxTD domain-containing protein [bacterium]MCB9515370.1 GWxTD domain-containing protein [Candidatus Latescibacterota bacterium]